MPRLDFKTRGNALSNPSVTATSAVRPVTLLFAPSHQRRSTQDRLTISIELSDVAVAHAGTERSVPEVPVKLPRLNQSMHTVHHQSGSRSRVAHCYVHKSRGEGSRH